MHQEPLLNSQGAAQQQFTVSFEGKQTILQLLENSKMRIGNSTIDLHDGIGLIEQARKHNGKAVFALNLYPRRKKFLRAERRYLETIQIQVNEHDQTTLKKNIKRIITNREEGEPMKILICFNPNAGSNSSKHLNQILAFIANTNLEAEVFETQHKGHCRQKLEQIDQKQYCAVAIVSGDGLMHEFVNSMCRIPVTHVPAGSGNAFAKTQMTMANQLCKDEESIFLVIKNRVSNFNVVKYELQKLTHPVYSFLSLEWAFVADLDINSEFLRFLGRLRFDIYAIWRLISLRRYPVKLAYSRTMEQIPGFETNLDGHPDYTTVNDTLLHIIFCKIPYIAADFKIAPLIKEGSRAIDMQYIPENYGRSQLIKYILKAGSGQHFDQGKQQSAEGYRFEYENIKSFRLEPTDPDRMGVFGIDGEEYEAQRIQASLCQHSFRAFT